MDNYRTCEEYIIAQIQNRDKEIDVLNKQISLRDQQNEKLYVRIKELSSFIDKLLCNALSVEKDFVSIYVYLNNDMKFFESLIEEIKDCNPEKYEEYMLECKMKTKDDSESEVTEALENHENIDVNIGG